jgi:hypothetical protein
MLPKCKWCSLELSPVHNGPCPRCGKIGKIVFLEGVAALETSTSKVNLQLIREYYEQNKKIKWLIIILNIIQLSIGLWVGGILGAIIGIIISIILYLLIPFIKIREIS